MKTEKPKTRTIEQDCDLATSVIQEVLPLANFMFSRENPDVLYGSIQLETCPMIKRTQAGNRSLILERIIEAHDRLIRMCEESKAVAQALLNPTQQETKPMQTKPLKLAVIYDPKCPKMTELAYSRTYLDMFEAVVERFDTVQKITEGCSAQDIEADVILIYDIHSAHHIAIDGLEDHTAVKYTYFNDPYQKAVEGVYRENNVYVSKLGARSRTIRALERGIDYIICPYKNGYYKHIAPWMNDPDGDMLFWFPPAPSIKRFPEELRMRPLSRRRHRILANGLTHGGDGSYDFRKWAFAQKNSFYVEHAAYKPSVPNGASYVKLLAQFTGALALCDTRIVPKYLEIPLAGCVCFAQEQQDYADMGFEDGVHYLNTSDKDAYYMQTNSFLPEVCATSPYIQAIADAGRKLIEDNWTAEHFANALYNHALQRVYYQT